MKDNRRKNPTTLSKQQQYDLEQTLLESLRELKRELSDYHGGEDNIPKDIKQPLDRAFEVAFERFQTTARSMDLSRKLEGQLPETLWNVNKEHPIFSGNPRGPFDVILERRTADGTLMPRKMKAKEDKAAEGEGS